METEAFDPEPAPGAELVVLAGDIDSTWQALSRFQGWPVPVLYVAGNHEFDHRELTDTWPALRAHCDSLGLRLLERESTVIADAAGRRIRFVGTVRWCDFNLFGETRRAKAMRAAGYFMHVMQSTLHGQHFGVTAVRDEALACREWLAAELAKPCDGWDATVAITHFGPSLLSADPRYGTQVGTAAFTSPWNATGAFVVGSGRKAGMRTQQWAGSVDDVRVWNRVALRSRGARSNDYL